MENGTSSSPGHFDKDNDLLPETSKAPQRGNVEGHGGQRQLARDELIAYLQRGLLWQEAVQHANSKVCPFVAIKHRLYLLIACFSPIFRSTTVARQIFDF